MRDGASSTNFATAPTRFDEHRFASRSTPEMIRPYEGSIRLVSNDTCSTPSGCVPLLIGMPGTGDSGLDIFDGRALLASMRKGIGIMARVGDIKHLPNLFVGQYSAGFIFSRACKAFFMTGEIYCGDALCDILDGRDLNMKRLRDAATRAASSLEVRDALVALSGIVLRVAKEYESAARVWSYDEASQFLYTRMIGKHRLHEMMRVMLDVIEGRDIGELSITRLTYQMSRTYAWLWRDCISDARSYLDCAVEVASQMISQGEVNFSQLVQTCEHITHRSTIAADAIAAVALAELGYVLQCERAVKSVLEAIAGESGQPMQGWVALSNYGSIWVAPFRAHTPDRRVLALDGRTWVRVIDEMNWAGGYGKIVIRANAPASGQPPLYEPLPYCHIEKAGSFSFTALRHLREPNAVWNDKLEYELRKLEEMGVPPVGLEVSRAVRRARSDFASVVSWKQGYTEVALQTPQVMSAYLRAKDKGLRMREVLYKQTLFMFHPHVTLMRGEPLINFLNGDCSIANSEEPFLHDLRQACRGWLPGIDPTLDRPQAVMCERSGLFRLWVKP